MLREHHSVCEWPPIRLPDGRVYGVPFIRIANYSDAPDVLWTCSVGIVQNGVEYSYWEFYFQFFESIFERGEVCEDTEELSEFARNWIKDYFAGHRVPLSRSEWGQPIWIDCR
jgi:hypothetical protein